MKKLAVIMLLALVPFSGLLAQIEKRSSKSFADYPVQVKAFEGHILVKNETILKDFVLTPDPGYKNVFLSGNWATTTRKIEFTENSNSSIAPFFFAIRTTTLDQAFAFRDGDLEMMELELKTGNTRSLRCIAEFSDPISGRTEKKLVIMNIAPIATDDKSVVEMGGDKLLFEVTLRDQDLGLNVFEMEIENETKAKAFLQNKKLGISIVLNGEDSKKIKVLAPQKPVDGVYTFTCRMDLATGVSPETSVDLFISNSKISLAENSANPLSFGDNINFSGKKTLVRFVNTRSEDVTIIVPAKFVSTKKLAKTGLVPLGDLNPDKTANFFAVNIKAGSSVKINMLVSLVRVVVVGKRAELKDIRIEQKSYQSHLIGW